MTIGWTRILVAVMVLFLATVAAPAQDSWYAQSSGTNQPLFDVCFANADNGWAMGNGAVILHTSNGGNTWSDQTFDPVSQLYDIFSIDTQNGWAVGYSGNIRHTVDGGQTWEFRDPVISKTLYGVCAEDMTAAPYNQPPFPASGDSDVDTCAVLGIVL